MTSIMKTLRTIDEIVSLGLVPAEEASRLRAVAQRYAIALTPSVTAAAALDPTGPIARQFIPDARELVQRPGETADPIGDAKHEKVPGLIHRYPDRVLMKITATCPVYCRFCFRREAVGKPDGQTYDEASVARMLDYIAKRPEIFEIVLTGGDPLVLSVRRISELSRRISEIPHIAVVRWHTRVPIVSSERVTSGMIEALKCAGKAVFVGIHTNHVDEFSPDVKRAISTMADAGLVLLSQTVLLKGINDDAATLEALFRALVAMRVRPYYLHHADHAPGTSHFRTTIAHGQQLMRTLRGRLSGLAQPNYVLDIPGGVAKVPIGPNYLDGEHVVDPSGTPHPVVPRG